MTFEPGNAVTSYVPPNQIIPDDWERAKEIMEERIIRDAHAINEREIAQYVEQEIVTGQKWFTSGDPNSFRQTFRKTIDFGALPNNTTKSVAHGISGVGAGTIFTRIYGCATDPSTKYIPIPYVELAGGNHIEINVDTTNVNIVTGIDYTGYTECYVVLEYIKE